MSARGPAGSGRRATSGTRRRRRASSATVHRRAGLLVQQRERRREDRVAQGGDPAVVDRRRSREVDAQHLDQHQLGQAGRDQARRQVGRGHGVGERVVDAGLDPAGRGTARQADHEHRRQRPHRRVEQRVVGVQVAADEVGTPPATAVAEHRHLLPRQRVEQREDRHALGGRLAAHRVVVAVGQHDHVARVGPVAHTVVDGDPARPRGDDVEQRQPIGAGVERVGQGERRRLELERLGELGAEEERAFEAELLERRGQRRRSSRQLSGSRLGTRRCRGHGLCLAPPDDRQSTHNHPPEGIPLDDQRSPR